jgi:hypothetical protein
MVIYMAYPPVEDAGKTFRESSPAEIMKQAAHVEF